MNATSPSLLGNVINLHYKHLGLRDPKFEKITSSNQNAVFFVYRNRSKSPIYVLKRSHPDSSKERLEFSTRVHAKLSAAKNCNVPKVVPTDDGALYADERRNGCFQCIEFITGHQPLSQELTTVNIASSLGNLLSVVHNELANATNKLQGDAHFLNWPKVEAATNFYSLMGIADGILQADLRRFEEVEKNFRSSVTVVHGDIRPENIVWRKKNNHFVLIDFDNCCIFHRGYELIRALVYLFSEQDGTILPKADCCQAFIRSYFINSSLPKFAVADALIFFMIAQASDLASCGRTIAKLDSTDNFVRKRRQLFMSMRSSYQYWLEAIEERK